MESVGSAGGAAKKNKALALLKDLGIILVLGFLTAVSYYCFVTPNRFAPGGIYGIGSMIQNKTEGMFGFEDGIPWAIPVVILNIPLIILAIIILDKRTAFVVTALTLFSNMSDIFLELVHFPQFLANGDPLLSLAAAAVGGILAGVVFAFALKYFGIADGTVAIAAIVKKKRPGTNIAWATFAFDVIVIFGSIFVYWSENTRGTVGFSNKVVQASVPVIYAVVNTFFLSKFCDMMLKGFSAAYKFEVVCNEPEEIAERLMKELGRGVTLVRAEGMYTHTPKALIICVVEKKQIGNFKKILKDYPDAFGYIMPSSDVVGSFSYKQLL